MSHLPQLSQQSYAFMKMDDGTTIWGTGPFLESAEAPPNGTAFYVNDFDLSDPTPWKIPTRVEILSPPLQPLQPVHVDWSEPKQDEFATVFHEITEQIRDGRIIKAVPTISTQGTCASEENITQLIHNCLQVKMPLMGYGYREGNTGFFGATPEKLFTQQGKHISTVALAGTASIGDVEAFSIDTKEIHEHEVVVHALRSRLDPLGKLTCNDREILDLGPLIHFCTRIELVAEKQYTPDYWVKLLHPTPALGVEPKTNTTLQNLRHWRETLSCPTQFGAPFGVLYHGVFKAVVSIRCIHYHGVQITTTSGCGIVKDSQLGKEWRELLLKRLSIRKLLGIQDHNA